MYVVDIWLMGVDYPSGFMAVKVAIDLGVLSVLNEATKLVSLKELAAVKQEDPLLVV